MKKIIGYVLILLSVVAWASITALPFIEISAGDTAAITIALVIGGEVAFFTGVALLGAEAWNKIKSRFKKP
jgi:hypothetical protein